MCSTRRSQIPASVARAMAIWSAAMANGCPWKFPRGNFHGQPLAMAADQIAIALATLAGICERRVEHMTNPHTSLLPAFLTADPGLNSGFMIAQVVAASL